MERKEMWKPVTISGITGIMMGAGAVYGAQELTTTAESPLAEAVETAIKETVMDDSLNFKQAFAAARAEIGADGLFQWRGNIYSTCTAEEWNAKTTEEKELVAQAANTQEAEEDPSADDVQISESIQASEDVQVAEDLHVAKDEQVAEDAVQNDDDDDVRVIGYGDIDLAGRSVTVEELEINGQRVAVIDVDKDGVGDIAMSDLNHNNQPDEGEIIDLHTGEAITFNDEAAMDNVDSDILNGMPA